MLYLKDQFDDDMGTCTFVQFESKMIMMEMMKIATSVPISAYKHQVYIKYII